MIDVDVIKILTLENYDFSLKKECKLCAAILMQESYKDLTKNIHHTPISNSQNIAKKIEQSRLKEKWNE